MLHPFYQTWSLLVPKKDGGSWSNPGQASLCLLTPWCTTMTLPVVASVCLQKHWILDIFFTEHYSAQLNCFPFVKIQRFCSGVVSITMLCCCVQSAQGGRSAAYRWRDGSRDGNWMAGGDFLWTRHALKEVVSSVCTCASACVSCVWEGRAMWEAFSCLSAGWEQSSETANVIVPHSDSRSSPTAPVDSDQTVRHHERWVTSQQVTVAKESLEATSLFVYLIGECWILASQRNCNKIFCDSNAFCNAVVTASDSCTFSYQSNHSHCVTSVRTRSVHEINQMKRYVWVLEFLRSFLRWR